MINNRERKNLIIKIIFITLISLAIFSVGRVLFLYDTVTDDYLRYLFILKEMLISMFAAIFVFSILYDDKKELYRMNNKAINYAFRDALTGLYNRRYLDDFLEKFSVFQKEDSKFAIIFIDIDNFKEINDNFGHISGDCILKSLAVKLNSLVRSKDILCRYGGEEFVVVLSDISKEDAYKKGEQIRITIQDMLFKCKKESITVSVGLSFGNKDDDINRLIDEADKALYMAKGAGKNCIKVFG
ncbi:MAG: GGDEF domain-containing protein [Campylobacterota bacterium]|nr:GGDEF domain-containing protein [Campylobacterota bacterium]